MKKLCLLMLFLTFGFLAFSDSSEHEIDFLLFLPDSSNRFINEDREMIHLDNLAKYLLGRNLVPGQIHVHGYTAVARNDIDPLELSRDRAYFVIGELQRRGVPDYLFSSPEAHGEVDIWGSNISEDARRDPNRRVRIMLDGYYLAPAVFAANETAAEPGAGFPGELLPPLLAILAVILLFTLKSKKRTADVVMAAEERLVNLEEEIRRRAYELYLARDGQNGDAESDWYKAVPEIRAQYEAAVYDVFTQNGCWWAHR